MDGWAPQIFTGLSNVAIGPVKDQLRLRGLSSYSERISAIARTLEGKTGNDDLLRSSKTGEIVPNTAAFEVAIEQTPGLLNDLQPEGSVKTIGLQVAYPNDDDHYVIDTDAGPIRISKILFQGEISIRMTKVPIASIREYRRNTADEPIAQTASILLDINGTPYTFEIHNLGISGGMRDVLKNAE